jgi:ribonuclease R
MVCDAVISAKGDIQAYQFYPAVIHSAARLTYTEVAAVLGNTRGPEATRRAALLPHLQNLYDLFPYHNQTYQIFLEFVYSKYKWFILY